MKLVWEPNIGEKSPLGGHLFFFILNFDLVPNFFPKLGLLTLNFTYITLHYCIMIFFDDRWNLRNILDFGILPILQNFYAFNLHRKGYLIFYFGCFHGWVLFFFVMGQSNMSNYPTNISNVNKSFWMHPHKFQGFFIIIIIIIYG